jgi:hypothetical protein
MPNVVVINESVAVPSVTDDEVLAILPALQTQWNRDLQAVWGVETAIFTFAPKTQRPAPGSWWVVFLDDSDQADALAYHDLTDEGLPISKVFVKNITAAGASLSIGASHEICEMAVDPWLNSAYQDMQGVFWAGEICDPVEDDQYGYNVGGVMVSDFVTPNWFGHKNAHGSLDFKGHANTAFQVLTGGYAQKFDPNQGWVQVTGAKAMLSARFHPSEGSRRDRRARRWGDWSKSHRWSHARRSA